MIFVSILVVEAESSILLQANGGEVEQKSGFALHTEEAMETLKLLKTGRRGRIDEGNLCHVHGG